MIHDVSELIAEASIRSGVPDVANRAAIYLGFAEKDLSRRLHVADAEADIVLQTNNHGEAELPDDFQKIRLVTHRNKKVDRQSLEAILTRQRCGYAITGKKIITSLPNSILQLDYYASLPPLMENGTNWLLESDPEIYMQAVLFQIYSAQNDLPKASATSGYLGDKIGELLREDRVKRFMGTKFNRQKMAL